MSDKVQQFQDTLFRSHYKGTISIPFCAIDVAKELKIQQKLDLNTDILLDGVAEAFHLYGNPNAIVLILVEEFEWNLFDQRAFELGLAQRGDIFQDYLQETNFQNPHNQNSDGIGGKTLRVRASYFIYQNSEEDEVAFVYFRTGYSPKQYSSEEHWQVRETIELSKAIKCPSINVQLINFKKIQQYLNHSSVLKKFLQEEEAGQLQENLSQIFGFEGDDKIDANILELIKENPQNYVLKPQREGGGNNYYDNDILDLLSKTPSQERVNYILMERIKPAPQQGFALINGMASFDTVISELGIYGFVLSNEKSIISNKVAGYLLRTKGYTLGEGGVSSGYAVIDSLCEAIE